MKTAIGFSVLILLLCFGAYAMHIAGNKSAQRHSEINHAEAMQRTVTEKDRVFLRSVVALAKANDTLRAASILTKDGVVIGRGWVDPRVTGDSSVHAEMMAIQRASLRLNTTDLTGSILYSSIQPCPLCLSLRHKFNVDKIIYTRLADSLIQNNLQVVNQEVYQTLKDGKQRHSRDIFVPLKDFE